MNVDMAYLMGMIIGNGEIQREREETRFTIDIPHKNMKTEDCADTRIYTKASIEDIRTIIDPLIGCMLKVSSSDHSTKISFVKNNSEYITREIIRLVNFGTHHSTMSVHPDIFSMSIDEKKSLLRGIADVTAYIRRSNMAFGQPGAHRVYIEIPGNWSMVITIANLLKDVDVPIQTIDFGHPNFRDGNLKKYKEGKKLFWKKEHQIKIFANEFLPIGFNIKHKQEALEKYSNELFAHMSPKKTHKFYWEKPIRIRHKPSHPGESDLSLPYEIRNKHYDSWTQLAEELGYGK